MDCGICLQPLSIFYYKSSCKCNVRYHYECIIKWYKISKTCVYCKKKDNIDINIINYRYNKYMITINTCLTCLYIMLFLFLKHFQKNFVSLLFPYYIM